MYPIGYLRLLHLFFILLVFGMLVSEWVLCKPQLSRKSIKKIAKLDGLYGVSSLLIVGIGFYMWFGPYGKGSDFYTSTPYLYIKLALFSLVGMLSISPTIFFLKNRKGDPKEIINIPKHISIIIKIETLLFLSIPFFAELMIYSR